MQRFYGRLVCLVSILLGLSFSLASSAWAQNINLLPEGQTLLSLTVTERVQVPQDTLQASLRIEVEDRDPQQVQNSINTSMEQALARVRDREGIEVSTGTYSVYQSGRGNVGGRPDIRWRGAQTLTLESGDSAQVLALVADLQAMGLVMNQLHWFLSQDAADAARNSLLESALLRAREQAERAAQALGKSGVELAVVEIDTPMSATSPVMMRAMAADAMEMSTPSAEAGTSEVSLSVKVQAVAR
ncbi:MAG: SIMPL domain-containing protein [Pseudomonadales bacterium]|nr:SIMPL domain-containing protein [Pseudomonadales bacterium]